MRMVDQFLEEVVEDMSGRKIVRVKILLLIADSEREDFDEAVNGFYKASEVMYWREDVVFGEVRSHKLLKEIYNKYGKFCLRFKSSPNEKFEENRRNKDDIVNFLVAQG